MNKNIKILGHNFILNDSKRVDYYINCVYHDYICNICGLLASTYRDDDYKIVKMGTYRFDRNVEITCDEQVIKNLLE